MCVEDYVKDQVSKDLGVPWHQIKPRQLEQWLEKGNEKVVFKDWWKEPSEEEKKEDDENGQRICLQERSLDMILDVKTKIDLCGILMTIDHGFSSNLSELRR